MVVAVRFHWRTISDFLVEPSALNFFLFNGRKFPWIFLAGWLDPGCDPVDGAMRPCLDHAQPVETGMHLLRFPKARVPESCCALGWGFAFLPEILIYGPSTRVRPPMRIGMFDNQRVAAMGGHAASVWGTYHRKCALRVGPECSDGAQNGPRITESRRSQSCPNPIESHSFRRIFP